eukprot:3513338-Amphidinium_carterae.1
MPVQVNSPTNQNPLVLRSLADNLKNAMKWMIGRNGSMQQTSPLLQSASAERYKDALAQLKM